MHSTFITARLFSNHRPRFGIRLIPAEKDLVNIGPSQCAYVCIGDYEEHLSLTIEEILTRLFCCNLENDPENGLIRKYASAEIPFLHSHPKPPTPERWNIFRIRLENDSEVDLFPGTWKSMAFILQDPKRMQTRTDVYDYFKNLKKYNYYDFFAKEENDFIDLRSRFGWRSSPQSFWGSHISEESGMTDYLLKAFGVNNRCWHGQGYIGTAPAVFGRVFLIKNLPVSSTAVTNLGTYSLNDTLPAIPKDETGDDCNDWL